ncbi:MAG: hypothetical protein J7J01_00900 [Methanophagales archaeon]|nr:hypothetical protein [Methanophagales archaeon]
MMKHTTHTVVRKTVEVDDELWEKMVREAVEKFGLHGAIKKAVNEAIRKWVEGEEESEEESAHG